MNYDKLKIGLIITIPVLTPPIAQFYFNIPAHLVLAGIIVAYLPVWYKLNYMNEDLEDSDV